MSKLTIRSLARTAIAAGLLLAGASALVATSAEPAMALCKYGTPHCINKNPGPALPTVNNTRLPDSNWVDPDCKFYPGLCGATARRQPPMKPGNPLPVGGNRLVK